MRTIAHLTAKLIVKAREAAAQGVDFSARYGALCPWCGKKTKIVRTLPWEGTVRIRYHKCRKSGCVLAASGTTIKSVEEDRVVSTAP